ncbi:hypothetical protein LPJ59_000286 [Coemansia sp. RSA 2399]|nr:hypothetical protein LPJ59_000286 [Coemansia sp. RSA 2399]KAJ1907619.1 hypothetical protein LPJ81_000638 [Coemansia sp. IMI 209127]
MLTNALRSQRAQCCRVQALAQSAAAHRTSGGAVYLAQQHNHYRSGSGLSAQTSHHQQLRAMSSDARKITPVKLATSQTKNTGENYAPYGEYRFRKSIERGRSRYSIRNGLTALGLAGAVTGIYFYSLHAVKQEDFSDVPMPPEPTTEEKAEFERNVKKSS